MSILGTIFGGTDVIASGIKLIDSLHTSTEEEIAAKTKSKTDLLTAYAPFKIAQRYLALMFSAVFLSSFIMVLGMSLYGLGNIEAVRSIISEFYIGEIMFAIIAFYFGAGFKESWDRDKK